MPGLQGVDGIPVESKKDLRQLMQDIDIWNEYKSVRGIIGRRLELLIEYLKATDQFEK